MKPTRIWKKDTKSYEVIFDPDEKREKIEKLDEKMAEEGFWDSSDRSAEVAKQRRTLVEELNNCEAMEESYEEIQVLIELENEGEEVESELRNSLTELKEQIDSYEKRLMLSGEFDRNDAVLSINAGAGGTESQDWAQMLFRMYSRWCENKDFDVDVVDHQSGEQAGIKSVTMTVEGKFAYGYLSAESGVHRLVRISPFDSNSRRHTSFAAVHAFPQIEDDIEVNINESDLRIDTYRASGAGGQHVNMTDSAVRITHNPTGIVVQCQNERSQHRNKEIAMKILRSKLFERKKENLEKKREKVQGDKKDIEWGSQIRSYVLHPYQKIKDHRTDLEIGNVERVLDGDIDDFVETYLLQKRTEEEKESDSETD